MIEYIAKVGGRYTYTDDFINLQELALSSASLLVGYRDFIVSGCEFTKQVNGKYNISRGYVWIDNKVRLFTGATDVAMDGGYYFVATYVLQSVKYAESATKDGRGVYGVRGQSSLPTQLEKHIRVTKDLLAPRIKDEFFGKHCILSSPESIKQTIYKNLDLAGDLLVSGEISASLKNILLNPADAKSRSFVTEFTNSSLDLTQYYGKVIKNQVRFLDNGNITFSIGGTKALELTPEGILVKKIISDEASDLSPDIGVRANKINRISGATDTDSIDMNYDGANGSTAKFRNFNIYDGKRGIVATFVGSNKNLSVYGTIKNESSGIDGLILKNTSYGFSESSFSKLLSFTDRNNAIGGTVGYKNGSKDLQITNTVGGVTISAPTLRVTGNITEGGVNLADKFVSLQVVEDLRRTKQDAFPGMGLSQENFTTVLKTKLDSIGEYATGGDIETAVEGACMRAKNLSDLADKGAARTNLGVMSTTDINSTFMRKENNLSDVADKAKARANIGAASIGEAPGKGDVYTKLEVYTKSESDGKYLSSTQNIGWTDCTRGGGSGSFTVKARKIGDIVNIQGTASIRGLSSGSVWFSLPNNIPAPPYGIGGVAWAESKTSNQYNRAMNWKCQGGSKTFMCGHTDVGNDAEEIGISITYFV